MAFPLRQCAILGVRGILLHRESERTQYEEICFAVLHEFTERGARDERIAPNFRDVSWTILGAQNPKSLLCPRLDIPRRRTFTENLLIRTIVAGSFSPFRANQK